MERLEFLFGTKLKRPSRKEITTKHAVTAQRWANSNHCYECVYGNVAANLPSLKRPSKQA